MRLPQRRDQAPAADSADARAVAVEPAAVPSLEAESSTGLQRLFINRNFALYTAGSFASATGSWFQVVALGWLVVSVAGRQSGFWLGVVGFAALVPVLLLGLLGGLLADRLERRRLLVVTLLVNAATLLLLAGLTATGRASLPSILTFALVTGIVNALTWPTWQALINEMVPPAELGRAIALNSARFNLTRVVGPALGGALLSVVGPGWCFAANAALTAPVIAALCALRLPPRPPRPHEPLRQALLGGLLYARQTPAARTMLLATAAFGVAGLSYNSFLPAFAKTVLQAGPAGLGLLLTAVGVGAIGGALGAGTGWVLRQRRRILSGALLVFGGAEVLFALSRWLPVSLGALGVLGFAMLLYLATTNTALQEAAPRGVLGRLLGVWVIVTSGATPLGSLALGALSAPLGVQGAVTLGGVGCVLCGLILARARTLS